MVDGRLKIDISLSEDFLSTWKAMEKVRIEICPYGS